jgi:hypothetical protein
MPCNLNAVELKLTENGNFSEVFDSGLRPIMLGGRSNKSCYVKDIEISLNINGQVLPMVNAARIDIDVLKNHLMDEVVIFVGEKMSIEEARLLAIQWGVDEKSFNAVNFENFGWSLVPNNEKWRANASFVSSYNESKPVLFRLFISWKRPLKDLVTHQGLLPPPPGYEHVSMQEKNEDTPKDSNPKSSLGHLTDPNRIKKSQSANSHDNGNTNFKQTSPFHHWLLPIIITLIVMIFLIWRKFRKTNRSDG